MEIDGCITRNYMLKSNRIKFCLYNSVIWSDVSTSCRKYETISSAVLSPPLWALFLSKRRIILNQQTVTPAPSANFGKNLLLGFQHLLAMYSGDVLVPLLIGNFLHFNQSQMTYLVSIDIFMCGIATLLQLHRTALMGIGLPVVLGCAV